MKLPLIEKAEEVLRHQNKSSRTEQCYIDWIYRFCIFQDKHPHSDFSEKEICTFLHFLANERRASPATQNQALQAILFLYKHVLRIDVNNVPLLRIPKSKRMPEVLNRQEVGSILCQMKGEAWLMTALLYGCGLRLSECISLRMRNINLEKNILCIESKNTEREINLPKNLIVPIKDHVQRIRLRHQEWIREGFCGVSLPKGVKQTAPNAAFDWQWVYLFPADKPSIEPHSGINTLHHRSDSFLEKAIKQAGNKTNVSTRVSCQVFRHSFAIHLLENGLSIPAVQKLLGHSDIRSTKPYVKLAVSSLSVQSPLDELNLDTF